MSKIVSDLLVEDDDGIKTLKMCLLNQLQVIEDMLYLTLIRLLQSIFYLKNAMSKVGQNDSTPSPHYLFFENKNGLNFRSLQSLYNQELRDIFHVGDIGLMKNRLMVIKSLVKQYRILEEFLHMKLKQEMIYFKVVRVVC